MKSYKQLITGIVIGSVLTGTIAIAGNRTFTATEADFPVVVNGSPVSLDMPVVTIEERTYLPLRAMGDILGVSVDWDGSQAVVTTEATPEPSVTPTAFPAEDYDPTKESNDGISTNFVNGKYYVLTRDIYKKYKGNYAFTMKDDDSYKISWRDEVFFETYPHHTDGCPELEWYNTVLQPWLVEKCK
ncbi:MAG: copper amine oxidase N-terminal domain-containing protein [Clostridia bacterium]|nr:copper amine oxidase N-terminal domain-containing protein [Clostridia bacterium]